MGARPFGSQIIIAEFSLLADVTMGLDTGSSTATI
jgi:hypothetical protein